VGLEEVRILVAVSLKDENLEGVLVAEEGLIRQRPWLVRLDVRGEWGEVELKLLEVLRRRELARDQEGKGSRGSHGRHACKDGGGDENGEADETAQELVHGRLDGRRGSSASWWAQKENCAPRSIVFSAPCKDACFSEL